MLFFICGDYHESMDNRYVGYFLDYVGQGFRLYVGEIDGELLIEADRDGCEQCVLCSAHSTDSVLARHQDVIIFSGNDAKLFMYLAERSIFITLLENYQFLLALSISFLSGGMLRTREVLNYSSLMSRMRFSSLQHVQNRSEKMLTLLGC